MKQPPVTSTTLQTIRYRVSAKINCFKMSFDIDVPVGSSVQAMAQMRLNEALKKKKGQQAVEVVGWEVCQ